MLCCCRSLLPLPLLILLLLLLLQLLLPTAAAKEVSVYLFRTSFCYARLCILCSEISTIYSFLTQSAFFETGLDIVRMLKSQSMKTS